MEVSSQLNGRIQSTERTYPVNQTDVSSQLNGHIQQPEDAARRHARRHDVHGSRSDGKVCMFAEISTFNGRIKHGSD
eukprot:6192954-Pleurochrysis_carterae.AAC.4